MVSTHSRPWAADKRLPLGVHEIIVSTHSRPWAAEALSEGLANPGKNRLFSLKPPNGHKADDSTIRFLSNYLNS